MAQGDPRLLANRDRHQPARGRYTLWPHMFAFNGQQATRIALIFILRRVAMLRQLRGSHQHVGMTGPLLREFRLACIPGQRNNSRTNLRGLI